MNLAPDDPRHGTENGYKNLRCRCTACREAWRCHYADRRAKKATERTCPNCGGPGGLYAGGECHACVEYRRRTGRTRPPEVFNPQPRSCVNCGTEVAPRSTRCRACRVYLRRRGVERPKHLWDDFLPCQNCLDQSTHLKGLCHACYAYLRRHGTDRPPELWGAHPRESWRPIVSANQAWLRWYRTREVAA